MCGSLVLLTPVVGNTRESHIASRLLYHAGRLTTYAFIGLLFGLVGESIVFAGLQRWLSILVGITLLIAIFFAGQLKARLSTAPMFIKRLFANFLHKRTYRSVFALGATNGLLPCGLVYLAATASVATGSALGSIQHMLFFGVGTLPMLLAISIAGKKLAALRTPVLQRMAPYAVAAIAILLIIRAQPMSLFKSEAPLKCPACVAHS
jgi:uncharacterized protein